jgi:hypothetical protein
VVLAGEAGRGHLFQLRKYVSPLAKSTPVVRARDGLSCGSQLKNLAGKADSACPDRREIIPFKILKKTTQSPLLNYE